MNSLRSFDKRINAVLVILFLVLILALSLVWERNSPQGATTYDRKAFASELLAHGLNHEALAELQAEVDKKPYSDNSLRLRKVMAEIMMEKVGDYEKALSELVFIRTFDPAQASATEDLVRQCLHRLGRVYDVQRRLILDRNMNPLKPRISSATIVRLGNEEGISKYVLEQRLAQLGLPLRNPPREHFDKLLQGLTGELLLRREATRSGIQRTPEFIEQVKKFEENLALQKYLEERVLKDVTVDEQALNLFLEKNMNEFSSPLRVVYSELEFEDEASARDFIAGRTPATAPRVISDHKSSTVRELPLPLQNINWETEPVKGVLGPLEFNDKWMVFPIQEVIPTRNTPPDLARQQARVKLLEENQSGKIAQFIGELAKKEELKIIEETIKEHFFPNASDTAHPEKSPNEKDSMVLDVPSQ